MKMFPQILTVILTVFFSTVGNGQNLVPNPSFEDTVNCPIGLGDLSVVDWTNPTTASPDHFHACNMGNVGVPQNGFGWQNARTGIAYCGFLTSDFSANEYREYIQCQLDSVLLVGELYEVSFYVSRTDSSTKACDNIGAYLSSTAIAASHNQNLPFMPQVVSPTNDPITEANSWIQIIDTIIAVGGEQFLTIGVFSDNANTNWVNVNGGWEDEAHYFVDDVSVIRVFPNSINELQKVKFSIYPNPSKDIFNITSNMIVDEYSIFSSIGQLIEHRKQKVTSFNLNLSKFAPDVYFIYLKTKNSIIVKKLVIN